LPTALQFLFTLIGCLSCVIRSSFQFYQGKSQFYLVTEVVQLYNSMNGQELNFPLCMKLSNVMVTWKLVYLPILSLATVLFGLKRLLALLSFMKLNFQLLCFLHFYMVNGVFVLKLLREHHWLNGVKSQFSCILSYLYQKRCFFASHWAFISNQLHTGPRTYFV